MARWNGAATLLATGLLGPVTAATTSARDFVLEATEPVAERAVLADSRCELQRAGGERASGAGCISCHVASQYANHPVDLSYEPSRLRARTIAGDLRPAAEVQRRGVRLVDGKVTCVTCHDASSKVADHLAIPRDAEVRPAVNPRERSSYAFGARPQRLEQVAAGARVSPTALCKACHALD